LFVDLVHADRGGDAARPAWANIWSHLVEFGSSLVSRGRTKPQNHVQNAK